MTDASLKNKFLSDIESNRKIIYKVCHLYTNNDGDFSDLYQEILLQLWKSYSSFQGYAKLSTWFYKISLNTALQLLRKDKHQQRFEIISLTHYEIPDFVDTKDREKLETLRQVIQKLNDIEKAIITLYLDESTYDEIANIIGISKTNVATKINRIKEKLKSLSNIKTY